MPGGQCHCNRVRGRVGGGEVGARDLLKIQVIQ